PLLHAAGELGGHPDRRGQKVHLVELRHGDEVLFLPGQLRELVERQANVFEDRQRTEEGAALVHDAELAQEPQPGFALGPHQVLAVDPDFPGERLVESDHDLEDGALARPRASENDEDLAASDLEVEILLDHPVAVADRDSAHLDRDRRRAHTCSAFVTTAKIASTTMIMRMPATTARVAESPTALGPSFVCMPRRHPRPATIAPNTIPLLVPTRTSETRTAPARWLQISAKGKPIASMTRMPPTTPVSIENAVSTGISSIPASTRCITRKRIGSSPMVVRALSS